MCIVLSPFVYDVKGVEGYSVLCCCAEQKFEMMYGIDRVLDAEIVDDRACRIGVEKTHGRGADLCSLR